jgi:hypothetical protein
MDRLQTSQVAPMGTGALTLIRAGTKLLAEHGFDQYGGDRSQRGTVERRRYLPNLPLSMIARRMGVPPRDLLSCPQA